MLSYDLARPHHYQSIRRLWPEHNSEELNFPTVVALQDWEVVGFLSTHPNDEIIIAGPLEVNVANSTKRALIAKRLIDLYESTLKILGIDRYLFYIDAGNKAWQEQVSQFSNCTIIDEKDGKIWYRKDLSQRGTIMEA